MSDEEFNSLKELSSQRKRYISFSSTIIKDDLKSDKATGAFSLRRTKRQDEMYKRRDSNMHNSYNKSLTVFYFYY